VYATCSLSDIEEYNLLYNLLYLVNSTRVVQKIRRGISVVVWYVHLPFCLLLMSNSSDVCLIHRQINSHLHSLIASFHFSTLLSHRVWSGFNVRLVVWKCLLLGLYLFVLICLDSFQHSILDHKICVLRFVAYKNLMVHWVLIVFVLCDLVFCLLKPFFCGHKFISCFH
jgi:hypothetical protein